MGEQRQGVAVRSYRDVVDQIERRIFRVDRWRLPAPHGVPVRAIGYALAILGAVLVLDALPLIGELLGLLPGSVLYLAVPALGGWALQATDVDGRPPHHVVAATARFWLAPRTLAGLRRAPAVGTTLAPVEAVQIAPAGDDARYRPGRVRGPATVVLRYPAELAPERVGVRAESDPASRLASARRIRVRPRRGAALVRGQELRVPEGREVVFE